MRNLLTTLVLLAGCMSTPTDEPRPEPIVVRPGEVLQMTRAQRERAVCEVGRFACTTGFNRLPRQVCRCVQ